MTDVSSAQLRSGRALIGAAAEDVAYWSKVGAISVLHAERGRWALPKHELVAITQSLKKHGVSFTIGGGVEPNPPYYGETGWVMGAVGPISLPNRVMGVRGPAFLYVISSEDGAQKVGFSYDPRQRLDSLQRETQYRLTLAATVQVEQNRKRGAEAKAHRLLKRCRIGTRGEWIATTTENAVAAIEAAGGQQCQQPEEVPPFDRDATSVRDRSQIRAAQAFLGWPDEKLAEVAGIGLLTVWRATGACSLGRMTLDDRTAIRQAIEASGVDLTETGGVRPIRGSWKANVMRLARLRRDARRWPTDISLSMVGTAEAITAATSE